MRAFLLVLFAYFGACARLAPCDTVRHEIVLVLAAVKQYGVLWPSLFAVLGVGIFMVLDWALPEAPPPSVDSASVP